MSSARAAHLTRDSVPPESRRAPHTLQRQEAQTDKGKECDGTSLKVFFTSQPMYARHCDDVTESRGKSLPPPCTQCPARGLDWPGSPRQRTLAARSSAKATRAPELMASRAVVILHSPRAPPPASSRSNSTRRASTRRAEKGTHGDGDGETRLRFAHGYWRARAMSSCPLALPAPPNRR